MILYKDLLTDHQPNFHKEGEQIKINFVRDMSPIIVIIVPRMKGNSDESLSIREVRSRPLSSFFLTFVWINAKTYQKSIETKIRPILNWNQTKHYISNSVKHVYLFPATKKPNKQKSSQNNPRVKVNIETKCNEGSKSCISFAEIRCAFLLCFCSWRSKQGQPHVAFGFDPIYRNICN